MELDHALEEFHLSLDDIKELLARFRRRPETDEIDRMAGIEGVADLALRFEPADAGPLARPRVHHNDRPFSRVGFDPRWRHDAGQRVVHWAGQRPTVHQHFMAEA